MPEVRKFLDLSTSHLPERVMNAPLNSIQGVVAYANEYGAFLWVPEAAEIDAADEAVPTEVVAVWRYARGLDCDYVLLDADGPVDPGLPAFDWAADAAIGKIEAVLAEAEDLKATDLDDWAWRARVVRAVDLLHGLRGTGDTRLRPLLMRALELMGITDDEIAAYDWDAR